MNPKDCNTFRERGICYSKSNSYNEAIADFDKALKLSPKDYQSFREKGTTLSYMKRYTEALSNFNESLKLCSDDFDTHREKGITLSKLENFKEAIESYDKALLNNPSDFQTYARIAKLQYRVGQLKSAESNIRKAHKIAPNYPFTKKWYPIIVTGALILL